MQCNVCVLHRKDGEIDSVILLIDVRSEGNNGKDTINNCEQQILREAEVYVAWGTNLLNRAGGRKEK